MCTFLFGVIFNIDDSKGIFTVLERKQSKNKKRNYCSSTERIGILIEKWKVFGESIFCKPDPEIWKMTQIQIKNENYDKRF